MNKHRVIDEIVCVLLVAAMCLVALSGCSGSSDDGETTDVSDMSETTYIYEIEYNELHLPYSKADTLDPFRASSAMNRQLLPMIYDSLFRVSDTFEAIPLIANSYSLEGTTLAVTISAGVAFSDGSYITSDDVAYSYEYAKESDAYAGKLSNFNGVTRINGSSLSFSLVNENKFSVACLDFPIVKENTVQDSYDTLSELRVPTGSGRYIFSGGANPTLTANNSRLGSFWPQISTIRLVNVSDSSALFYSIEIGNISFAFDDLSGGKYTRATGNSSEYLLNNLVYLGINAENESLGMARVRRAIDMIVNRTNIVETAFQGHAVEAYAPFNPQWFAASGMSFAAEPDGDGALAVLEDVGFDRINTYDIRNDGSKSLTFKLIVNSENEFKVSTARQIASSLAQYNIHVSVNALAPEDFLEAYELMEYDLYIGEISLSGDMSLAPFFASGGAVSRGIYSDAAGSAYYSFAAGELDAAEYVSEFVKESPFIPLCFRKGVVAASPRITGATESWYGDLYNDIENWIFE